MDQKIKAGQNKYKSERVISNKVPKPENPVKMDTANVKKFTSIEEASKNNKMDDLFNDSNENEINKVEIEEISSNSGNV
jgi:hypothetical protein